IDLASGALVARLDVEEAGHRLRDAGHAGAIVEDDEARGAEAGADLRERAELGRRTERLRRDDPGGDARERRLDRAPRPGPAADVVEELAQGEARGQLVDAGAKEIAREGEEHG